jgi:Integrase
LKLAPLVFLRPGEIRSAEWQHFSLESVEWRIPGANMKMGEVHIVPLSRQAMAILHELFPVTGHGKYLFPNVLTPTRCMSENTVNSALRRMGYS